MIDSQDVVSVNLTADEVETCKRNPVAGVTRLGTGQLKAVGNLVLRKLFGDAIDGGYEGVDAGAASQFARETGVAMVCRLKDGRTVGIVPTVSVIKDDSVLDKKVIVPANQLYKHPRLDSHYTVAVYVRGHVDANKELVSVDKVFVAGWVVTSRLRDGNWVAKGGSGAFTVQHASLAIAPSNVLDSLRDLDDMVHWKKFRI